MIKFERSWAMPSKNTFKIKPISDLLKRYDYTEMLDAFPFPYERDAIERLNEIETSSISGVLFDPPYSQRQLKELYGNAGLALNHKMNSSYWRKCKDEIARVLTKGGRCISFGWNSNGLGKNRGFEIIEILIVPHGGQHNDTIVTVEESK